MPGSGDRRDPLEPGNRITRHLWRMGRYFWINVTSVVGWIFFFVLNRTTVEGREHVPDRPNTLLLSNHQSMIDSWLVGISAYYPQSWCKPELIPWNPAAEENFFRNRIQSFFFTLWKCIPIKEGRRDIKALYRMTRAVEDGVMILFPEGTRSRDGRIGDGRPGAGLVVLGTRATVIPVTIEGMSHVLPIGSRFPRFGRRIHVVFGEPVDYSHLLDRPRSKETAQELVDRVIEILRQQQQEIPGG